jgi:hypothetical protein
VWTCSSASLSEQRHPTTPPAFRLQLPLLLCHTHGYKRSAPPWSAPPPSSSSSLLNASTHVRPRSSTSYARHHATGRSAPPEADIRYIHHRGVTGASSLRPFPGPAATKTTSASTLRCSPTIPPVASTAPLRHHRRSPLLGLCRRG